MSVTDYLRSLRQSWHRASTSPSRELGRWAKVMRFQIQLWRHCTRRLHENNAPAMSAALSFRTIFAMVPVIVLALLVMKSIGMLGDGQQQIRDLLDATGLSQIEIVSEVEQPVNIDPNEVVFPMPDPSKAAQPDTMRRSLADLLMQLIGRVERELTIGRVGPVGIMLLIWSALSLLTTLERSLNRIFGATRSRPFASRTMLYWAAVTLGPVLLAVAWWAGNAIANAFEGVPVLSALLSLVGWLSPVLLGVGFVASLYKLMPNTRVSMRTCLGAAILVVPLWLLAKNGFGLYIRELVVEARAASIYGVLGLLPLFLVWLNLSWLLFLFGAELAHTATNLGRIQAADERRRATVLGPSSLLASALAVGRGYQEGRGAVAFDRIGREVRLSDESLERLLDRLAEANIVCPVHAEGEQPAGYVLARPAEQIDLGDILGLDEHPRCDLTGDQVDDSLRDLLHETRSRARACLGSLTLAEVLHHGSGRAGDRPYPTGPGAGADGPDRTGVSTGKPPTPAMDESHPGDHVVS